MLGAERRNKLLQMVDAVGVAHVGSLAERLGVSPSTIRRDLSHLQEQGLLNRTHGGAVAQQATEEPDRPARTGVASWEKRQLAQEAVRHLRPGTTVLITGGTTTAALAPLLDSIPDLTVVTNSLHLAGELAHHESVTTVVLGGYLRHREMSLLGHLTRQALEELHIDEAFVGAYGINSGGISGAHVDEAETDRWLLSKVQRVTVLVDGSKFGRSGPVRVAPAGRLHRVITDSSAPEAEVAALVKAAVDVVRV
ncbi:Glucitol operon repressor [Streptomyces sp. YIM 130001]|uniref:DeoR/GlpR family DNA-binding transcription regulator n=1 Tax=Streptomyces sp. YIM 130001 TaxID=2259644 RepID=UPI000EE293D0|nr:DeoR/GlpR family DNA-binding transcription regulator [Streptomyces sp. YIM 130001]RII15622.1 Glucitol operon repressor [Streptomyces sp. YIM 130001]